MEQNELNLVEILGHLLQHGMVECLSWCQPRPENHFSGQSGPLRKMEAGREDNDEIRACRGHSKPQPDVVEDGQLVPDFGEA